MLDVLRVTFPFFALVLCGYLAARKGFLSLQAIPGLNGFVLFFALPCMLFRFGASTPIAQLLDAEAACRLAVFLHGAAGDLAEGEEGQAAMTASDILAQLGPALTRLMGAEKGE